MSNLHFPPQINLGALLTPTYIRDVFPPPTPMNDTTTMSTSNSNQVLQYLDFAVVDLPQEQKNESNKTFDQTFHHKLGETQQHSSSIQDMISESHRQVHDQTWGKRVVVIPEKIKSGNPEVEETKSGNPEREYLEHRNEEFTNKEMDASAGMFPMQSTKEAGKEVGEAKDMFLKRIFVRTPESVAKWKQHPQPWKSFGGGGLKRKTRKRVVGTGTGESKKKQQQFYRILKRRRNRKNRRVLKKRPKVLKVKLTEKTA